MLQRTINSIIDVFLKEHIIKKTDKTYYTNMILGCMGLEFVDEHLDDTNDIATLFNKLGDFASASLKLEKDSFINGISGLLLPPPSEVNLEFQTSKKTKGVKKTFEDFYNISKISYYIKYDRLAKNIEWDVDSKFGKIDMTINLSKPEKTPAQIMAAKLQKNLDYPKCVLCKENIGFFGNAKRDSRQNIRYIDEELNGKKVFMHYSPYGYYDEHLIINNYDHKDMKIDDNTLKQLLEFVEKYPFYFIGSNSDIPIVGGSILSHQHYQGGAGTFPIFNSKTFYSLISNEINIELLEWPLSTIKISGVDKDDVFKESSKVLKSWYDYENKEINIFSKSENGLRQNAVTPLAKMNDDKFEIYLILRNNGTSEKFPEGIFHVKEDVWNIKKENIGIIEAAGKAILPGRLIKEFDIVANALKRKESSLPKELSIHDKWYKELINFNVTGKYLEFVKKQAGLKFVKGLADCGVFHKKDSEFKKFIMEVFND